MRSKREKEWESMRTLYDCIGEYIRLKGDIVEGSVLCSYEVRWLGYCGVCGDDVIRLENGICHGYSECLRGVEKVGIGECARCDGCEIEIDFVAVDFDVEQGERVSEDLRSNG